MRAGFRKGDAAEIAVLELVDRPETGEAAAALGFFAARLSDKLDEAEHPSSSDAKLAAINSAVCAAQFEAATTAI